MRSSVGVVAVALALSGCNDIGLSRVALIPESAFKVPATQTLEGGGQLRFSASGFNKMMDADLQIVSDRFVAANVCVPKGSTSDYDYCHTNPGAACATNSCAGKPSLDRFSYSVVNAQTLRVSHTFHTSLPVPVKSIPWGTCAATFTINDIKLTADLKLGIDPTSGELVLQVTKVDATMGVPAVTGCSGQPFFENVVASVSDSFLQAAELEYSLHVAGLLEGILPNPSLLGKIDASLLLLGESRPEQPLEVMAPNGGYSQLVNNGLSVGIITGFNADADPATRSAGLASEAAACAADVPLPDLASWGLPATSRSTYLLSPNGVFAGTPEAIDDVEIGVSQGALTLAGAHIARSGVLCADYDDTQIASLHRDSLDDLLGVPLAEEDARLHVSARPTAGLALEVGDNTLDSPAITARLPVAITISTEQAGEFVETIGMKGELKRETLAEITGDTPANARISFERRALQTQFDELTNSDARYATIADTDQRGLLGTVAELVLGSFVRTDQLLIHPLVAGYPLGNLRVGSSGTGNDKHLIIGGALDFQGDGPGGGVAVLPAPVVTSISVESGDAASVRAAVLGGGEGLPVVTLAVPAGPEYVWRIGHGSSGVGGGPLQISDRSLAWQGAHRIEVRARAGTDERTTSAPTEVTAVIDYAPPTIFADSITVDGSLATVPARDAVTPASALRRAFGRVGGPVPTAGFINDETVDLGALADGDEVMLYVADEADHVASVKLRLHGEVDGEGGSGGVGGSDGVGATAGADVGESGGTAGRGLTGEAGASDPSEAGAASTAGTGSESSEQNASDDGGCGCRLSRTSESRGSLLLAALGLVLVRRRTRRA